MPSFDVVSVMDISRQKAVKRRVDLASLESADAICGLKAVRQEIRIRRGIDTETAKRFIKIINFRNRAKEVLIQMSSISRVLVALGALSLVAGSAVAGDAAQIRAALAKILPDVQIDSVTPSPIDGLFEVMAGTQLMYVTGDGRYFFDGRIVDLKTRTDISEPRITAARQQAMAKVDETEMVIFAPDDYKHTITVFTDIDCGYCRKLHNQMEQYGEEGIRVRYLFYPRAGKNSESYKKAVSVWCADDRQAAMTDAKNGKSLESKTCDNPVDEHMALGKDFGVRGTPALVLDSGDMVPGYVEPKRLAKLLEQADK